jgi:hypothetical protein
MKKLESNYVTPSDGYFAIQPLENEQIHWDHCREQFAAKFTKSITGFFFTHPKDKYEDIEIFLTKFERICHEGNYEFSVFSKTNKSNVLWIEVSKFWLDCSMRKSLLTILLRCSMNYDSKLDNFEDVLFNEKYKENLYLRQTKNAITRFMFGFYNFTGPELEDKFQTSVIKHGWKQEFLNMDEFLIKNRLKSNQEFSHNCFFHDALWI